MGGIYDDVFAWRVNGASDKGGARHAPLSSVMTTLAYDGKTLAAMTAMKCGKTAVQAVKVACQLDIHSREPINSVRIKK